MILFNIYNTVITISHIYVGWYNFILGTIWNDIGENTTPHIITDYQNVKWIINMLCLVLQIQIAPRTIQTLLWP